MHRPCEKLAAALDAHAWDGDWYRRAFFDDGTPLGSAQNPECRIDSLPQSWAVLAGGPIPRAPKPPCNPCWTSSSTATCNWSACSIRPSTPPPGTPATSRATSPASAKTADNTPTPPSGSPWPSPPSSNPNRPGTFSSSSTPSTTATPPSRRPLQDRTLRPRRRPLHRPGPRRRRRLELVHRLRFLALPPPRRRPPRHPPRNRRPHLRPPLPRRLDRVQAHLPLPQHLLPRPPQEGRRGDLEHPEALARRRRTARRHPPSRRRRPGTQRLRRTRLTFLHAIPRFKPHRKSIVIAITIVFRRKKSGQPHAVLRRMSRQLPKYAIG
jgi:hypothetical protein